MLQLRKQQVGVVLVHVHHELAVHTQKAYHLQLLIGQASPHSTDILANPL